MATRAHSTSTPERRPEAALPSPARRSLFGGLAAAVMLPAAAPLATAVALEPDAVLIATRNSLVDTMHRWDEMGRECANLITSSGRGRELHLAMCDMVPSLHAMEDEIADTPATTYAGLRAKADALRLRLAGHSSEDEPMDPDDNLAWSLAQDVLRLIAGAA